MFQIYLKEIKELLRDRKTLFFIIALPLLIFPVLFGVMGAIVANVTMDEQQKVLRYVIVNETEAPEFAEAMFYHRDFKKLEIDLPDDEAIKAAIDNNQIDVVLKVSQQHQELLAQRKQDVWSLYFNNASQVSFVRSKINKVFDQYVKDIRAENLVSLNISEADFERLNKPIDLKVVDTADERENIGEKVGGILPYMLIILCLTGAMYPAIDIGAGEKERGTLETLLLTPIPRFSIVLGKFFVVMTTGIVTALITVFSLGFWSFVIGEMANVEVVRRVLATVGALDLVLILLMLIPVSSIFASIVLSISIYARSFKEAQNYMGPMSMFGFFPVLVAMLPGIKLDWTWALVPISNVALAIKEIVKGTIDYSMLFAIFASSTFFAALSIAFCVYWFNKESVLFR